MREIGSEFSYVVQTYYDEIKFLKNVKDYVYTFSGRTAIETIIKNESCIKKVMLPSYCCDSMIVPFRDVGIEVDFYEVNYNEKFYIDIDIKADIDAILWCNYFGFNIEIPDFSEFIKNGGILIEDITHSFLSKHTYSPQSKYLIGSIRKWIPVLSGGICVALNCELKNKPKKYPEYEYLHKKKDAMVLKYKYLYGEKNVSKEEFLNTFSECNTWLANNYSCMQIDDESIEILNHIDWKIVYEQRRCNAEIVYNGLKSCNNIKPLFDINRMDCPLFVPVVVRKENRQSLRQYLIDNKIYCPIHWPKPNEQCKSNLYDIEMSLICDQRYSIDDMKRMISVIREWDMNLENGEKEL